jgi:sugar (pentulose or hexulose) kinase
VLWFPFVSEVDVDNEMVVGLDLGSSRIKAAAYDRRGALVRASAVDTPLNAGVTPGEDSFPVGACLVAAVRAVEQLSVAPGAVRALGVSSMGEVGTVLSMDELCDWDFPAWYDRRGSEVVARLVREHGQEWLTVATGNHAVLVSTVAKLGHMVAGSASVEGTFLGLCGALAWNLTRVAWQEAGLATTSGVFDPVARTYLPGPWRTAGLGSIDLPPVREAGFWAVAATPLASGLGLAPQARIVIAGHDHPVGTVGAGVRLGEMADSLGTGEAILVEVAGKPALHAVRGALLSEPALSLEVWPDGGGVLAVWGKPRPGLAMRTFVQASGNSRRQLDAEAPPPGAAGVLDGELVLALECGDASGLQCTTRQWGALIDHYVLQSVRAQRWLRELTGASGATVLTGGGLRSRRWRHAHAILGEGPLAVSTVPEAGTRGAAGIAGTSLGWWPAAVDMPGATRVEIRRGNTDEMDRAAWQLFGEASGGRAHMKAPGAFGRHRLWFGSCLP